jgi:hypothetical protein
VQKGRPFTKKQRHKIRKRLRTEAAAERRALRDEQKAYDRSLTIFKKCDPERTEALSAGRSHT